MAGVSLSFPEYAECTELTYNYTVKSLENKNLSVYACIVISVSRACRCIDNKK